MTVRETSPAHNAGDHGGSGLWLVGLGVVLVSMLMLVTMLMTGSPEAAVAVAAPVVTALSLGFGRSDRCV